MGKKLSPESTKRQLKKGQWTAEEDLLLKTYIETHGEGKWTTVSQRSGLMRAGKSCRMRWMNYLRPNLKHGAMSQDEEDLIIRMHKLLGNRWSLIAGRLPGRTDNEIKNYWHTHLGKRQQHLQPHDHQVITSTTTTNNSIKYSKKRRFSSDSPPDHHHQTHDHPITTPINKDHQSWPCGNRSTENNNGSADEIEDAIYNYVQNSEINGRNINNNVLQCSKLLPGETAYYEEPFSPALSSVLLHYHSFENNNSNPSAHVDQYYSLAGDDGTSPLLYLPEDFYTSMVLI